MECPKCGEPFRSEDNYCSHCGMNPENKVAIFDQHKKAVKKAFLEECREIIGEHRGCCKLGQAAWFIATNTPSRFDYLQGEKRGTPESFQILKKAVLAAKDLACLLADLRKVYNAGQQFAIMSADNFDITRVWIPIEDQSDSPAADDRSPF